MNALNISTDLSSFGKNWFWFVLWGAALIALGAVAISAATLPP